MDFALLAAQLGHAGSGEDASKWAVVVSSQLELSGLAATVHVTRASWTDPHCQIWRWKCQ